MVQEKEKRRLRKRPAVISVQARFLVSDALLLLSGARPRRSRGRRKGGKEKEGFLRGGTRRRRSASFLLQFSFKPEPCFARKRGGGGKKKGDEKRGERPSYLSHPHL